MRLRLARWLRSPGGRRLLKFLKRRRKWLLWALALLLTPILLINLAITWVGHAAVFPLSPFFLKYKVGALAAFAWHRPRCMVFGDEPITAPLFARVEQRNHLPCGLLGAIAQVESGRQPHRISYAGAMGPMQLIPPTARSLGVNDPYDPEQALDGAARYLRTQLDTFHSIRLAAAAYNAGPGAIVGHRVPHNGQTEIYVEHVLYSLSVERRARCTAGRRYSAQSSASARPPPGKLP
jgi:hypothetical protein